MVMLRDSLLEFWANGMYLNTPMERLAGNVLVYQDYFQSANSRVKAIALGISGDHTSHLLYRLLHGEMPDCLNPKIWWICIGTNDFGEGKCRGEMITAGILHIIGLIHGKRPQAEIVVNALLPRGKEPLSNENNNTSWQVLSWVNRHLQCYSSSGRDWVHFANDTDLFLSVMNQGKKVQVNKTRLPDYLHPSKLGFQAWGHRIVELASKILEK